MWHCLYTSLFLSPNHSLDTCSYCMQRWRRKSWGRTEETLCIPRGCSVSPSLLREGTSGLLSRAELGHLFHISLHAQSRWVTAVIGIRDPDKLRWLSLLRCSTSTLPLIPFVKHLIMSKSQKRISAKAHTAEVSVHQFWTINQPISFCSAPSFCWMWFHLLQLAAFFFQDFTEEKGKLCLIINSWLEKKLLNFPWLPSIIHSCLFWPPFVSSPSLIRTSTHEAQSIKASPHKLNCFSAFRSN